MAAIVALVAAGAAVLALQNGGDPSTASTDASCADVIDGVGAGTKVETYQDDLAAACASYEQFIAAHAVSDTPYAAGAVLIFCGVNSLGETPSAIYNSNLCVAARDEEPLLLAQAEERDGQAQSEPTLAAVQPSALRPETVLDGGLLRLTGVRRTEGDPLAISATLVSLADSPFENCQLTADLNTPSGIVRLKTGGGLITELFNIPPKRSVEVTLSFGMGIQDRAAMGTLDGSDFGNITYDLAYCDAGTQVEEPAAVQDPEGLLLRFLDAWGAGDRTTMRETATPEALAQFTEDPADWSEYFLNYDSQCADMYTGRGECSFNLVNDEGSSFTYLVYYAKSPGGGVIIDGFEPLGGGQ